MDEGGGSEPALLGGRYELGSLLGHGGMAAVHDATDRRLGRRVAVKVLRADLAEQASARRRFETEAHAAARLAHPNVVTVFDSGETDGVPFIVMERLPGRTLVDELAAGPLTVERAREVGREVLSALGAAHAAGIIHRDVKPGNVLLTEDGHVKVSDFGIAKAVDEIDQTQTTDLVATPEYLAPERVAGEPASQRSDLYSVGVLLYRALSGRRPFEGDTPLALIRAIERGRVEPLTSVRPALPPEVIAVVERAMSRDPSRRFESAVEMAAALQPSLELDATVPIDADDEAKTVPVSLGSRDGATEILHLPRPQGSGLGPGATLARRRVRGLGVAAALTAIVVGAVVISERGHGPPTIARPASTSSTATITVTTRALPAPLDDAIRKLEQAVAK
jgi:serine/threonine-protein kinase